MFEFFDFSMDQLDYNDPSKTSGGSYMGKSYLKMENKPKMPPFYIQLPKI